ncbi:hypothetical protein M948_09505 [Virgibacillus sp. CM-4]|nr:hypothetical protein M948_09505 [Virgibacillus sp. CM-4]
MKAGEMICVKPYSEIGVVQTRTMPVLDKHLVFLH